MPIVQISPSAVDFGEVVVGTASEIGLRVVNSGYGTLRFSEAALAPGSSGDFSVASLPEGLGHDQEGAIVVRYTPDAEGGDAGVLRLQADAPDVPPAEVTLTAIGVIPAIDLDPEVVYFGVVAPGESTTRTVRVGASGSGDLRIRRATLGGEGASGFTLAFPEGYVEPYTVPRGFSFDLAITFAPDVATPYEASIVFDSNDPEDPLATVRLLGNTEDDPTENEAPVVQILDPNDGRYLLDDVPVALSGTVADAEERASDLLCAWYADGARLAAATPGADGGVTATVSLPIGEVSVALRCYDGEGAVGEDVAEVVVWDHTAPLVYTVSGGDSMFDFVTVDDDLSLTLDGVAVWTDDNGTRDTHAPIALTAARGQSLRVRATDQNYCDASLGALTLHWGSDDRVLLLDDVCRSACPDHACYDPTYVGPWPSVFVDTTVAITIP